MENVEGAPLGATAAAVLGARPVGCATADEMAARLANIVTAQTAPTSLFTFSSASRPQWRVSSCSVVQGFRPAGPA
jgi:hypothetical protein